MRRRLSKYERPTYFFLNASRRPFNKLAFINLILLDAVSAVYVLKITKVAFINDEIIASGFLHPENNICLDPFINRFTFLTRHCVH